MAQDRRDCLMPDQSVADNISVASLDRSTPAGLLDVWALRRQAQDQVTALHIKTPTIDAEVRTLSGGNQQKVQVARWLAADARIFVLIDPTRGVDVGARSEIKQIWFDLSRQGRCDPDRLDRHRGIGRRLRPSDCHAAWAQRWRAFGTRSERAKSSSDGGGWLTKASTARPAPASSGPRTRSHGFARASFAARRFATPCLLVVLAAVWIFFYCRDGRHVSHAAQSCPAGAADCHRQPCGHQRGDADRHPELRSLGWKRGRSRRCRPRHSDGEERCQSHSSRSPFRYAPGLVMGAWQGWWVTRVGVSSFIVTLAGMLYFRGISMIATNGATVAPLPKSLTGLRHRLPTDRRVDCRS